MTSLRRHTAPMRVMGILTATADFFWANGRFEAVGQDVAPAWAAGEDTIAMLTAVRG